MADQPGVITRRSAYDAVETVRRLHAAIQHAGLTVFADIDHGRNAAEVGLPLRATRLLVFGDPRGGTLLMQQDQAAGLDLPLRALVWEDASGAVQLAYVDPHWIAERYGLGSSADAPVAAISAGLQKLAAAATT